MYSTKIVKKKKINAVCGIALLLSVIFLMTSCPNGINVDNANGNNPGGNHHEGEKVLTFSVNGGNGTLTAKKADSNGAFTEVKSGAVIGKDIKVGDVIHFTAEPDLEHLHYTVDWNGVDETLISKKRKSATLKVASVSQNVSVSFRGKTDQEILDDIQIDNESFYSVKNTSSGVEVKTVFENGKTPSAWLGLARKEGDNKLYLITMDDYITKASCFITQVSTIQENGRKISKEVSNNPIVDHPVLTGVDDSQICFDSVKDALEWRWKNMIVDFPDPDSPDPDQNSTSNPFLFCTGSYPWLTFWPSDMFGLDYVGLLFAVKTEENEPKVYFRNDGHSKLIADWTITFVKADKVYAFKVGGSNYKILHDANNHLMNNSEKISGENIKFKIGLSSLVEISLMEQFVKAGISEKDAGDKANNFVKNFAPLKDGCKDLKDWDVYLTLGDMIDDKYNVDDGRNPLFAWRNTFKLVEANPNITNNEVKRFWSRCWK